MSITYHHYGAVLIAPHSILSHLDPIAVALADLSVPTVQTANHSGAAATVEALLDRSARTQTLTYRTSGAAPEIAEYVATCTVQRVGDEPSTTLVEWSRVYRPAMHAERARSNALVAKLLEQDHVLAARFAAACDAVEVLLIDYTLGGAAVERRANRTANRFAGYAQAA